MNIGIDISQIVYQGTGSARFTQGLVNSICNYDKNNHWIFFFSSLRQKLPVQIKNKIQQFGGKIIQYSLPPTLLSLIWNDWHVFSIENIDPHLDWFITSDWTEPPARKTKKATIVHDLAFLRFPEAVAAKTIHVQKKRLQLVKQEAQLVFADSQSTKKDLIKLLDFPQDKIKVVYPGVEKIKPSSLAKAQIMSRFSLVKPYVLTVGKIEPRKNLHRLISAFEKINNPQIDLVIVGPKGWEELDLPINNRIRLLGFVNDQQLVSLYENSLFFISPSIWEGFGYPVIEAMQLGIAVACSNTSSLQEIVGDAALTFDPFQVESIQKAITTLLDDKKLRLELAVKGKKQQQRFTWKNYYNELIHSLEKN